MTLRVAYLEEPPFYGTDEDGSAVGADVELARLILGAAGESSIEFVQVDFGDLLIGVETGKWDVNVPIFVTPERAELVAFSLPVWSLGDGFLVESGNPHELTGYDTVAAQRTTRLGLIPGQVQFLAAQAAGVSEDQIVAFSNQHDAVAALLAGAIDAFAATAVGNRAIVATTPGLDAVPVPAADGDPAPLLGAFSVATDNQTLLRRMNAQLSKYLGSGDHRSRMARYGITRAEIDGALLH